VEFVALSRFAGLPPDFAEDADRTVEAYLLGPAMGQVVDITFELHSGTPDDTHAEGWEMNVLIPIIVQLRPRLRAPTDWTSISGRSTRRPRSPFGSWWGILLLRAAELADQPSPVLVEVGNKMLAREGRKIPAWSYV
jgi:hypothetical protein